MTFQQAIIQDEFRVTARVLYKQEPIAVRQNMTFSANVEQAAWSVASQVLNDTTHITHRIATTEPNYWRMDGTFALPVQPSRQLYQIGWWSNAMSNAQGVFNGTTGAVFTLETIIGTEDIPLIGIAFDRATNNYCRSITVQMFGANNQLLYTESTTTNDSYYYQTKGGAVGVARIVITVNNTNNPQRHIRLSTVNFGTLYEWDGDDIVSIRTIMDSDPTGKTMPYNEYEITLLNKDGFRIFDPQSIATFIQVHQSMEIEWGAGLIVGGEAWVYGMNGYISNWNTESQEITFRLLGALSMHGDEPHQNSFSFTAFGQWMVNQFVGNELGLELVWQAPSTFPVFTNNNLQSFWGDNSNRRVLAMMGELACCHVYENNINQIVFEDLVGADDDPDYTINYDFAFDEPHFELGTPYNGIMIREYTVTTGYSRSTFSDGRRTISLRRNESQHFTHEDVFYPAPWKHPDDPEAPYFVNFPNFIIGGRDREDDPLWVNESYAPIRDWFLERKFKLLRKRLTARVIWWQNPTVRTGDIINLQADRDGNMLPMRSYRHEMRFDGALSGSSRLISRVPEMVWNYKFPFRLGEKPFRSLRRDG